MKFYHVTTEEAIKEIQKNGFNLELSGTQGGEQLGKGLYLSQQPSFWAHRLGVTETLAVEVEMENICQNPTEREGFGDWLQSNGWTDNNGPTEKGAQFVSKYRNPDDAIWTLTCEWLKSEGFSGMWDKAFNNLVIWNLEVVKIIQ
ncbi:MAG: hypothetical protein DRP56_04820 [Planctomycetota bacterium]|nr:MAG: hypothetical protein DRP56_04820 [Planctomycetota bacterium]